MNIWIVSAITFYWFIYFWASIPTAYFEKLFVNRFRQMPSNEHLLKVGLAKHEVRGGFVILTWVSFIIITLLVWFFSSFDTALSFIYSFLLGGFCGWILGQCIHFLREKRRIDKFFFMMDEYLE